MLANRPIRVAQVATTAMSIRYLLTDHIERLRAEGFEVDAVCAPDSSLAKVEASGITVRTIPFVREPSPVADVRALEALYRLLRSRQYDIVHSHTPKAGLLAPVAARLARTPAILHTVHGLLFHDRSRPIEKVLGAACEFWTARFAHSLLSQSREDVDVAVKVHLKGADRIDYLGNGIDIERFHPRIAGAARPRLRTELGFAPNAVVIGMVGRLVREKGFIEFFAAMKEVLQQRPEAHALIVGPIDEGQSDGLDAASIKALLPSDRATWLGHRDDLPELYSAMDVFALPSYREGVPRTLMEASAMALPVIASNIRGCREVTRDGITGILVEPRTVAPLAAAITRLVDDAVLRAKMGAAGREHIASSFDARLVLDRLSTYYKSVARRLPGEARA